MDIIQVTYDESGCSLSIPELCLATAKLRLAQFNRQMPHGKAIRENTRYATRTYSGIGYTYGGKIVGIPDIKKDEQMLEAIYYTHRGFIPDIERDQMYNDIKNDLFVYELCETSNILRLDDGSLVGIQTMDWKKCFPLIPIFTGEDDKLCWRRYWMGIVRGYNILMHTYYPDQVINTVLWFDEEQE